MANNIFNNFNIGYNSIADQKLTAANTLTVKAWNDIITILKTQANINATYLSSLSKWLIGENQVSIPGENSFVEYVTNFINNVPSIGYYASYDVNNDYELPTTKAVNKIVQDKTSALDEDITYRLKTKADLVDGTVPLEQLDHAEVEEISIGKSTNYNLNSDDQVLTSKAINSVVNKKFNEAKDLIDNNTNEINTNKINIESNNKSIQANATYAQALSQRITDTESTLKKKADLVDGKVPASQLPGYVDDVIEGYYEEEEGKFYTDNTKETEIAAETSKIYVDVNTNKTYRWGGSQYVEISQSLALGETPNTAFPGNRGKALELKTVKKTTENVQNTSLRDIKSRYGNVVAAQYNDKYVLLVFGKTINENNECSLTVYDNGTARYAENIWLEWTLGQALNVSGSSFNSRYTYTDTQIDKLISSSPMSTYEVDLTEASWVRLAKVKDLTKNSSGQFIFDCYGRKANDEGIVLESIIGTTPKPNRKYELEMDVTLRELYNRFNATMPFEIKLNTSHYSTKTALYFGANGHGTNSNIINNPGPYNHGKELIDSYALLGIIYWFNRVFNEELQKDTYTLDINKSGFGTPNVVIDHTEINEDHFRLIATATSYSNDGTQQRLIPPYTLYRNGIEIFKNERYIENTDIITLEERNACSVALDDFTTEDVFTIEYSKYPAYDVKVVSVTLHAIYDIDTTVLTMKGFIEGTDEYIQSVDSTYPITKITEYDSHKEILTTSVFNVTCGLDDNGNLITDVLPITQSPELSGSDSSGGISGGGDATSSGGDVTGSGGGSGLTGTHGLTSILLENYEGETYVCGLINFPNTGNYFGTYIEMKIENNLNFETLNRLEVVDIEEKTENGEFQLLEGTKFEPSNKYDFTITSTLFNMTNAVLSDVPFQFSLYIDGTEFDILRITDTTLRIQDLSGNTTYERGYEGNIACEFFPEYILNGALGENINISSDRIPNNLLNLCEHHLASYFIPEYIMYHKVLRLSGDIYIEPEYGNFVTVCLNGVSTQLPCNMGPDRSWAHLVLQDVKPGEDLFEITSDNGYVQYNLRIDPANTIIETRIKNIAVDKEYVLESYSTPFDATVKGISYKFHKTSDSYDLFSVYNKLDKIDENVAKIGNDIVTLKDKFTSENISVTYNEGLGEFPGASLVVNYLMSNVSHSNSFYNTTRRHFNVMFRGMSHGCDLIGNTMPTDGVRFINNRLLTENAEILLDGNITPENYINFTINCKTLEVSNINKIKQILRDVMYNSSLTWYPMFVENNYFAIGYNRNTIVTTDNSCADDIRGTYSVSFNYEYIDDSEGNRFTAQVFDITRNRKYLWSMRLNKDTYNYETLHAWLYSKDFPEYTSLESGSGAYTKTEIDNKLDRVTEDITELTDDLNFKADLVDGKVPASQLPSGTSNNMIFVEPSEIITLVPNQYHILDAQVPSNITLTLQDYNSDETSVYREYMGEIRVDENTITATVPEGIRWNETDGVTIEGTTLTLEGKKTYLFSILNYIGLISSVANPQLDAPVLTLEGSVLSWEPINNTKTYRVYMVDNDLSTLSTTQIDLQDYITDPGIYIVYVEAKDNYYTDNVNSIEYVVSTTLTTPVNLVINESNTLSWDSIENASSYLVTLKETSSTKTVTTNLCDLTTFTELSTAGTYTFVVSAVGDNKVYLTSSTSATITVTIPEA